MTTYNQNPPLLLKKTLAKLPFPDKARNKGYLKYDDYLSIDEISRLITQFIDDEEPVDPEKWREWNIKRELKEDYKEMIIEACSQDLMAYEGRIHGWLYRKTNPFDLAKQGRLLSPRDFDAPNYFFPIGCKNHYIPPAVYREWQKEFKEGRAYFYVCEPEDCTIHREEFKRYWLTPDEDEDENPKPITPELANWFGAGGSQPPKEKSPKLKADHVKDWVTRTGYYEGGKTDPEVWQALKKDNLGLWGDSFSTLKKWLQTTEAKEVRLLLPNKWQK